MEQTPKKETHIQLKKPYFDYARRSLDICAVCKNKYNVGDRIPRILVNCGHTFCTSCLLKYHHGKDHIRCPSCKKLVKHLDNVETLPLNLSIFGEIVKNDPVIMMFIDPSSEASFASSCPNHPEKQRHYYCSFHENNFCRECMKAFHKGDKCCVVDLCDIQKLFQLNEQNLMKNELIVKTRNKAKGKMRKEEFFIANQ
jgi:LSD1 subclass zinc finger protein